MPGHANLSDLNALFEAYTNIFMRARYSYEKYKDLTNDEIKERGERWIANGGKIEDADFAYYPSELTCLIAGLSHFIEDRLSIKSGVQI